MSGHILHNLLYFGRLLRGLGLDVQPDGIGNLLRAFRWISIANREEFRSAAKALLIRRQQDIAAFDKAFDQFWSTRLDNRLDPKFGKEHQSEGMMSLRSETAAYPELTILSPRIRYSFDELLREKDFSELDEAELEAIKPMLSELGWRLGMRLTRRWRKGGRQKLNVRRVLRQSIKTGGELMRLAYRDRRTRPRGIVVIADVSGSMELYSELFLHFIYGLHASSSLRTESFVFSTRLTRISRQLRGRDVGRVVRQISKNVLDWSGGTRIGQALKAFNFNWSRRVLGRGQVVIVVSDGWDRGENRLLRDEIARLQRSCFRLIWLNPLLGSEGYEPRTRGMHTALPFIDDFLPIHNLRSLEQLADQLERIEKHRPMRRQQAPMLSAA